MLSIGMYGLMLAGGIAIGVLGTALYHDSIDAMVVGGDLICEWHGCRISDVPAGLVNPNGTSWAFDDFESCHAWAAGAALDEVRWCWAYRGMTGEIWRAPDPNQ